MNRTAALRTLRVAQVVPVYPPHRGGMGQVAHEYTTGLRARGHQVHVFTPHHAAAPSAADGVNHLAAPLRAGNAAFVPSLAWRLHGFDIVHLHYPFFGGVEPILAWKLLHPRQPLVVSYVMDPTASGVRGALFRAHRRLVLPRMLGCADRVLVSTDDYVRSSAVRAYTGRTPQIEVHPYGVDAVRFSPGVDPELRVRFGINASEPVLLFVAALDRAHHFKGLPVLLEALVATRALPWHLVVVGDGDLRREYAELAARTGLGDRIHFAGDVSDADLPRYYRMADVHVFPSTGGSEAFGLVTLEAAASGLPTIVSALPGVRTVVIDHETGLHVPPRDVGRLGDAIRLLIEDGGLRARLGAAARRRAEAHFGWDARIAHLERTYVEVMASEAADRLVTV